MTRYYDPVKQYYILAPYHDPTRPLLVPRNVNDDFSIPTLTPNSVPNFFPKMNKLIEIPLDDLSLSLHLACTQTLLFCSINFLIAKSSSSILKKNIYKSFAATTNIPDEINKALPKVFPHLQILNSSLYLIQLSSNNPLLPMSCRLLILMFASTPLLDKQTSLSLDC